MSYAMTLWSLRSACQGLKKAIMYSTSTDYEGAITALNGLQSNASVLEQARLTGRPSRQPLELERMQHYLKRTGLKVEDLDSLNAIHIAGTKGKGSVCAMCERILRAHGLKTGFYSSPHLIEVRERIRLNGQPLTKSQFVSNFWECYSALESTKNEYEGQMPAYFRFLTVMAFHVFLKENVDVAIVEVGIGGTYDSTNIIRNPVVCGITSLGFDHVDLLGPTLDKIAWQKAGICKPGRPCYTIPQAQVAMKMLAERAKELKASSIEVTPPLSDYPGEKPVLGLAGDYQMVNASLAIQICKAWLLSKGRMKQEVCTSDVEEKSLLGIKVAKPFPLSKEFYDGLRLSSWPGRSQTIKREGVTFYLDGGHTPQSMEACADWFKKAADEEAKKLDGKVTRVLLFNTTGRRNAEVLLKPLVRCGFQYAAFSPNVTNVSGTNSADQTNLMVTTDRLTARCKTNHDAWLKLQSPHNQVGEHPSKKMKLEHENEACSSGDSDFIWSERVAMFDCLSRALRWCSNERGLSPSPNSQQAADLPSMNLTKADHVQVLVAGSLHLVGAVMNVLRYTVEDL